MKITLEDTDAPDIAYVARVEIIEATVDYNTVFNVPVYVSHAAGKAVYNLEICGFRLEAEQPDLVPQAARRLLAGLINMSRLPDYVFIARRSRGIYPVYTVGHEVLATTPGGPVFRHVELAKVREYLCDYLHATGVLGTPGRSDKLHVRGVSASTLALRRPLFYLKKRVSGQADFWAPVFAATDGRHIYTYAASARRGTPVDGGLEALALQRMVAAALMADGRLLDPYDLRIDRLFPVTWDRLRATLTPATSTSANGVSIALYTTGELFIGLENRPDEVRYSLFLGRDSADVKRRATQDFARRGVVSVKREA